MDLAPNSFAQFDVNQSSGGSLAAYECRVPSEMYEDRTGMLTLRPSLYTGQTSRFITVKVEPDEAVDRNRVGDVQQLILKTFGIKPEFLAEACGVSRKTLYNWRGDVKPRKEGMDRLFSLYQAAINWRNAGYPAPDALSERETVAGKTLHQLLVADELDLDAVQFLGSRIVMGAPAGAELSNPFA